MCLLWQCARRGWDFVGNTKGQPTPNHFTWWYTRTFEEIAAPKAGHVVIPHVFELLIKGFTPELENLKPLCRKLRRTLFPLEPCPDVRGTPKDPDVLYGPMIEAFDEAIVKLSEELRELSVGE